ncbi:MAG TPA: hypothetical protein VD999_05685 [Vitreimonas sp.]|nr:hypothetical protein [Vitreimonas sp.]
MPGTSCAIIAHEREALDRIFEIVKRAYVNLPKEIKPETKTDTKRAYYFAERFDGKVLDSSIYVALKLRSGTVQHLHITESSKIKDRQELVSGSKQAVPLTGRISEETTGNGYEGFYDAYMQAHSNLNPGDLDYKTYFYPWFDNPEYSIEGELDELSAHEKELVGRYKLTPGQILWRRWKVRELAQGNTVFGLTGEQLFKQEYPSTIQEAFQSAAGNVFTAEKLDSLNQSAPIRSTEFGLKIWKEPIADHNEVNPDTGREEFVKAHNYIVGVDPSDGSGADFGCIDVWDEETFEQVAQFYGKVRPDELSETIKKVCELYNNAYVGVENNMLSTILFLSKIYDNYYSEVVIDEKTNRRTKKLGWNTNSKTRDVMVDDFIVYFEEGHLKINSAITISEMKTFVRKDNGKREHADGKHDDTLIAAMIALQMKKYRKPRARAFENKAEGF